MIIDIHAHFSAPDSLYVYKANLLSSRGTAKDPVTGKWMDDTRPLIESISWLTESDKRKIFEENARAAFNLKLPVAH